LDEATSAVSETAEEQLFDAARHAGVALLTVGHRLSLLKVPDSLFLHYAQTSFQS
jgi:ABC-type uncharacterized transport system fused permease/ATPase subunit